jgi:N-acetylneuraminate synthase
MQELDRASNIEAGGPLARKALAAFRKQLRAWDLAMPAVKPLVLDFGLGDFYRIGLVEYWIANEIKAGYCGKYLFLFDRQTCPRHHHLEKKETFFIVKGTVEMDYSGRTFRMKPGDVLPVECGKPHQFRGIGPALIIEISRSCIIADNFFTDLNIPIGGNYNKRAKKS